MTPNQHAFPRTDRTRLSVWWWTTDHLLLGATAILITIGVLLSFGNSPAAAARMNIGDPFHFAVRQCIFAFFGAIILIVVSMLNPRGIRRSAFFIYLVAVAMMIALPLLGHHAKGATRWVEIGGFSLQPSEFMKPALIVLASWMFAEGQKGEGVPGVSIAFGLYAVAVALLLIQPDVGQTILITIAFGAAFFMAGVPMKWILGLGGAALAGGISLYFVFDNVASRRLVRPRSRRGHIETPGARRAHRLRLCRRSRGIRPDLLAFAHHPLRLHRHSRALQGHEAVGPV